MVAHGEQGLRRLVGHLGAAVEVPLPVFSGRRAAGGRPVSLVGGPTAWGFGLVASRRETGLKKKNHFSSFFCIASSEEEERGTVPFKTVPFGPLFFFFYFT